MFWEGLFVVVADDDDVVAVVVNVLADFVRVSVLPILSVGCAIRMVHGRLTTSICFRNTSIA